MSVFSHVRGIGDDILPEIFITVTDRSHTVRIDVDGVGASFIIMSSETGIPIPPMLEDSLVLPRFIPPFLLCFLANVPAK